MDILTDDLVQKCLVRVPYTSHEQLKHVCRSWEGMVSSPCFYADREKCGKSEQFICFIQQYRRNSIFRDCAIRVYDPVKGTWKKLGPIDADLRPEIFPINPHKYTEIPRWCKSVVVNRKLVLIGEFYFHAPMVLKSVYIYDFESARWSRGADMPTPRSRFACCVSSSNGLVYVAGGVDESYNPLAAAATYNVEEDKWEILPPMTQPHHNGCEGFFMQGKFLVIDSSAEVFDPSAGTWRRLENMWSWRSICMAVSSSDELYAFSEQQVMKYDAEKNVWSVIVAPFPEYIASFTCATQWRDCIFVIGVAATGLRDEHKERFMSYLFNPSTGRFIEVNGSEGFETRRWGRLFPRIITCAATLEI